MGLLAVCLETRHVRAAMSAQRGSLIPDAASSHTAAQSEVQGTRVRKHHPLKSFGIRIKGTGRNGFEKAVRTAVADDALTRELMDGMVSARAVLWKQYCRLHDLVVRLVAGYELARRFMVIPGVGPVTALSFIVATDDPSRFRRSRDLAAYFGLMSRRWQSDTSIDLQGRISKGGDPEVRRASTKRRPP